MRSGVANSSIVSWEVRGNPWPPVLAHCPVSFPAQAWGWLSLVAIPLGCGKGKLQCTEP